MFGSVIDPIRLTSVARAQVRAPTKSITARNSCSARFQVWRGGVLGRVGEAVRVGEHPEAEEHHHQGEIAFLAFIENHSVLVPRATQVQTCLTDPDGAPGGDTPATAMAQVTTTGARARGRSSPRPARPARPARAGASTTARAATSRPSQRGSSALKWSHSVSSATTSRAGGRLEHAAGVPELRVGTPRVVQRLRVEHAPRRRPPRAASGPRRGPGRRGRRRSRA